MEPHKVDIIRREATAMVKRNNVCCKITIPHVFASTELEVTVHNHHKAITFEIYLISAILHTQTAFTPLTNGSNGAAGCKSVHHKTIRFNVVTMQPRQTT
jgi:hypothetical protein